ncbi:MAG: tetratricopeptide repeat protein [Candidatus Omnitrophica bacterium]|nr:tetratricopeptide repeat protein [Candidatus Omnitrophota bacterium]
MEIINKTKLFPLVLILIFSLIIPVCAADKPSPTLEKGIGQYKHENYDESIITLKTAREEDPKSTLAAFYLGLAYKQTQDYKGAVSHLRDAVTYEPKIKGALIELIDCLYQINELDEAKKWIVEAESEAIRPAQTAFLKGLVLAKAGDGEGAITAFEKAKELDKSMAQAANYQIGVCCLKDKKLDRAKRAFEEVVLIQPGSNMANYANEYVNSIEKQGEPKKPFRMSVAEYWQYDDNVVLMPSDSELVTSISDKGDSREVTTATADYDMKLNDMVTLTAHYGFYWAKQNDLGFYDTLTNNFLLQPTFYFKNSVLTIPSGYNHTLVNDKAYLSNPVTTSIYNVMVGNSSMLQSFLRYQYRDYLWQPITPAEDKDGSDFGGGVGWYTFFAKNKGFINIRYALNKEWTDGNNWEYVGNRVGATVLVPVLDKLNVSVTGDAFFQNFANSNTIFGVVRKDQVYTVSSLVAYKFYKDSEVQLQYTFVKDSSNVSFYDYNRNIYSAGVEIKF